MNKKKNMTTIPKDVYRYVILPYLGGDPENYCRRDDKAQRFESQDVRVCGCCDRIIQVSKWKFRTAHLYLEEKSVQKV